MSAGALAALAALLLLAGALPLAITLRWPSRKWSLDQVPVPWDSRRPSIHDFLVSDTGTRNPFDPLPDEEVVNPDDGQGVGWVAGALDGVMGHHGDGREEDRQRVDRLWSALEALLERSDEATAARLYERLTDGPALAVADPLIDRMVAENERREIPPRRLHAVARWIAEGAPDREAVKLAIVWLGLVGTEEDRDLLVTLGGHDELTLFAATALMSSQTAPETALWELGRRAEGWGRVHVVERLAETEHPGIRAWLLREGAQNAVMNEYTAAICARTGRLHEALREPAADDALLTGAGAILQALVSEGPAEDVRAYPEAPRAMALYLDRLAAAEPGLDAPGVLVALRGFLATGGDADEEPERWPEELRRRLLDRISDLLAWEGWRSVVDTGLQDPASHRFDRAVDAAGHVGLDVWEELFEHAGDASAPHRWWWLTAGAGKEHPGRMERVVEKARAVLPLEEMATGPAMDSGLGPDFSRHQLFESVVEGLADHPGLGWDLVRTALRSPVVRQRLVATGVLAAWPAERWPAEAPALVDRAHREEPDETVRKALVSLCPDGSRLA